MKLFICSICFLPLSLLSQLTASLSMDVAMCVGTSGYTMTFTGANGTAPYTFTYTINGGSPQTVTTTVGNSVSVTVSTAVAGTFNYQLSQVSDDTGANQAVTDNAFATVYALPTVSAGSDQTICLGTSVTVSGSGATTYTWDGGITNGVAFAPPTTTTFTVIGTSNYGCINTDQVVVTVNPIPIVGAGSDQWICPGYSTILFGSGASTYSWNNGVTNGVSFTPIFTSTYTVIGTSVYGCINTDQVIVYSECAGINEIEAFVVTVSPNPTTSLLNIESESIIDVISVYTLNGQLVKQLSPNSQKSFIDLRDLTQGFYLLEMNSEKGRNVRRIIVQ